jgi:AraC family transcriptional regulator
MDTRIVDRPAFRLVGHAARVPLIHQGINPHIQRHVTALPQEEHLRLKGLGDSEPGGLLQVTDDVDPDAPEGSELTYLHGVAVSRDTPVPDDLDAIEVPAGTWAVFHTAGPHDRVVPVQPVASTAGALDRRGPRSGGRLQLRDLRTVATRRIGVTAAGQSIGC